MERLETAPTPALRKLRGDQLATRSTWGGVPDSQMSDAAMHTIHIAPANASTTTRVNRLDPGTVADRDNMGEPYQGVWLERPGDLGAVRRAG